MSHKQYKKLFLKKWHFPPPKKNCPIWSHCSPIFPQCYGERNKRRICERYQDDKNGRKTKLKKPFPHPGDRSRWYFIDTVDTLTILCRYYWYFNVTIDTLLIPSILYRYHRYFINTINTLSIPSILHQYHRYFVDIIDILSLSYVILWILCITT
jgi:hypothetical protein